MDRLGFIGLGIMGKPMAQNRLNVPTPIGAAGYRMYSAASGMGSGRLDFSAVCKAIETLSGVKIAPAK